MVCVIDWYAVLMAIWSLVLALLPPSISSLRSWYYNCPPLIRRIHLFEFHDFSWFPHLLRVLLTNNLRAMWRFDSYYKRTLSILLSAIQSVIQTGKTRQVRAATSCNLRTIDHPLLIDLCSGAGGPIIDIQRSLANGEAGNGKGIDVDWILTDLYPNINAFKSSSLEALTKRSVNHHYSLDYNPSAVDATNCKINGDMRTLFASFHHMTPPIAQLILKDAFVSRTPISIIEATERSLWNIITFPILSFLFSYVGPFLAPFSFAHFFFTFIIPVLPFLMVFDGFISVLRCYSPQEIVSLVESIEGVGKKIEWAVHEKIIDTEKESLWYQQCKIPIEDDKYYVWRVGIKRAPWYKISTPNIVFYQGYITA